MSASRTFSAFALFGALAIASPAFAASFSDVPESHGAYEAIEYLKSKGIISGYPDGTFKPDKGVNRAEALKIIVAPLVSSDKLATMTSPSPFSDVAAGAWFAPYVEWARTQLQIIDGPPAKTAFLPENLVMKAEFLKMLQLANKVDPVGSFAEIRLPLSDDVQNPDEWFYPYTRYALSSSMTMINGQGLLEPGRTLSRGDVSLFLYRFLMYKQGRRTQALLSEAEGEIKLVRSALVEKNAKQAEFASARALLAARGAHASMPDIPLVQGALKVTEAYRALVRAYTAGVGERYDMVVELSGEAWNLAERAKQLAPDLASIVTEVQSIAKSMADSARTLQGTPAT